MRDSGELCQHGIEKTQCPSCVTNHNGRGLRVRKSVEYSVLRHR
jgi:hypothetical protein